MKTTVDIPEDVLKEAMRNAQTATKRDAVLAALEEYNRRRRLKAIIPLLGKSKTFMTRKELLALRAME